MTEKITYKHVVLIKKSCNVLKKPLRSNPANFLKVIDYIDCPFTTTAKVDSKEMTQFSILETNELLFTSQSIKQYSKSISYYVIAPNNNKLYWYT